MTNKGVAWETCSLSAFGAFGLDGAVVAFMTLLITWCVYAVSSWLLYSVRSCVSWKFNARRLCLSFDISALNCSLTKSCPSMYVLLKWNRCDDPIARDSVEAAMIHTMSVLLTYLAAWELRHRPREASTLCRGQFVLGNYSATSRAESPDSYHAKWPICIMACSNNRETDDIDWLRFIWHERPFVSHGYTLLCS